MFHFKEIVSETLNRNQYIHLINEHLKKNKIKSKFSKTDKNLFEKHIIPNVFKATINAKKSYQKKSVEWKTNNINKNLICKDFK